MAAAVKRDPNECPKFLARRAAEVDADSCIIVVEGKDITYYFNPKDWGGYFKCCQAIVKMRMDNGDYADLPPDEPTAPIPPTIQDLPPDFIDEEVTALFNKRKAQQKRAHEEYLRQVELWQLVQMYQNGVEWAAATLLDLRRDYEYEGIDIAYCETPGV